MRSHLIFTSNAPARQQGSDHVTVAILDADFIEPSGVHDTSDVDRIVSVALIDLHLEDSLGQARYRSPARQAASSSVRSHVAVGPLSSPTRTASGALDRTNASIASGSESTTTLSHD